MFVIGSITYKKVCDQRPSDFLEIYVSCSWLIIYCVFCCVYGYEYTLSHHFEPWKLGQNSKCQGCVLQRNLHFMVSLLGWWFTESIRNVVPLQSEMIKLLKFWFALFHLWYYFDCWDLKFWVKFDDRRLLVENCISFGSVFICLYSHLD